MKEIRYYSSDIFRDKQNCEKETYKQWLLDKNVSYDEIQNRLGNRYPKELVRYRSFNHKHSKSEICDETIFLSFLYKLNDPFEGAFYIDHKRYYRENPLLQRLEAMTGKKIEEHEAILGKAWGTVDKISDGYREISRVACFTQDANDLLMWSHYANGHAGYCIHYDTERLIHKLGNCKLLPVLYSDVMCDATDNVLSANWNLSLNPALIKGTRWEYENEWRLLSYQPEKQENDFKLFDASGTITRIDIGCKCGESDQIIRWCKDKKIPVYKKRIAKDRFELLEERL